MQALKSNGIALPTVGAIEAISASERTTGKYAKKLVV